MFEKISKDLVNIERKKDYRVIRLIEIVRNIPTNLSILSPLLNYCVKETQHIDERSKIATGFNKTEQKNIYNCGW